MGQNPAAVFFCVLTEGRFVLPVADGVPFGVMPPAGDFSRGRKVTKSPLRTYGSKDSLALTCTVSPPRLFYSCCLRRSVDVSWFSYFRASARSLGRLTMVVAISVYRSTLLVGIAECGVIRKAIITTKAARRSAEGGEGSHPAAASEVPSLNRASGQPVHVRRGILRTIGSKSTFAYFSLTRKVGRRRQNTRQYTVGYRQSKQSPVRGRKRTPEHRSGVLQT